ncbi:MAG: 50S ribosomal protein L23 [Candidatus Yanofskybacteria bacterium]|nr:50S ribosomal protein L23 [Candidatus Yanofskybacteria bacterium]
MPKGGDAHSYDVVIAPYITEKGTLMLEHNKYVFRVSGDANKNDVSRAVKNLYKVEVDTVHIVYMPSKHRRVGRHEGRKPGFKKAIVTLKEGSKIDLAQ